MRKITTLIIMMFIIQNIFGSMYTPCRLIMNDGTINYGQTDEPGMFDKEIVLRSTDMFISLYASDSIKSIIFSGDEGEVRYDRVRKFKGFSNKKASKSKIWLKVLKSGYLTLYFGLIPAYFNSPGQKQWYFRKQDDEFAHFLTLKYFGGLILTIGSGKSLIDNSSKYLNDCPELVTKIKTKEYRLHDIDKIVDEYNFWKLNQ